MGFTSSTRPDISNKEQTRMLCNCAKLRVRLAQESKGVKSEKQLLIDPTEGKDDYRQIVVDLAQGKDKTVRTLFIADEVEDNTEEVPETEFEKAWAEATIKVGVTWKGSWSGPPVVHEEKDKRITLKVDQNTWGNSLPLITADMKPLFDVQSIIGSGTFLQEK